MYNGHQMINNVAHFVDDPTEEAHYANEMQKCQVGPMYLKNLAWLASTFTVLNALVCVVLSKIPKFISMWRVSTISHLWFLSACIQPDYYLHSILFLLTDSFILMTHVSRELVLYLNFTL